MRGRSMEFAQICEVWALADHWPLEDGIRLLRRMLPRPIDPRPDAVRDDWLEILLELANNCIGFSLPVLDSVPGSRGLRVRPTDLLRWAESKGIPIPDELQRALLRAGQSATGPAHAPADRHRERCRALAALLWRQEPHLALEQMVRRSEVLAFGCEGVHYEEGIIRGWLEDLRPL